MGAQNPNRLPLPIHGFVLAGGKSTRMGADKATTLFCGRPMAEIAVAKLRTFCAQVSIAGNRDDLAVFAPVVREQRLESGPGAGVEAGLLACAEPWALYMPVDVPLVPAELLWLWCDRALHDEIDVSYLGIIARQPAFCLLRRERLSAFTHILNSGERRLVKLLQGSAEAGGSVAKMYTEADLYGYAEEKRPDTATLQRWFTNVNTPAEFAEAERHCDAAAKALSFNV